MLFNQRLQTDCRLLCQVPETKQIKALRLWAVQFGEEDWCWADTIKGEVVVMDPTGFGVREKL